jgi:hypothetical protein
MNTVRMNTSQARGEGVDREIIFVMAIHPPAPEKLCQRGSSRSGLFVDRSSVLCLNVLDREFCSEMRYVLVDLFVVDRCGCIVVIGWLSAGWSCA